MGTRKGLRTTFLICLMMAAILLCFSSQIQASQEIQQLQEGDFTYTVINGKAQITGYSGAGGEVTVPSALGGIPITSIGKGVFEGCESLTSIDIPESVTNIDEWAFSNCTSLYQITIPNGVRNIGYRAFINCKSLTSITIPEKVENIGDEAFSMCTGLTNITVDAKNSNFTSIDDVLYDKAVTTLVACPGSLKSVVVPEGVTSIRNGAFHGCSALTSIDLPETLTSIGEWAFRECTNLRQITIPKGVAKIYENGFGDCTNLASITFNSPTTEIILFLDPKTAIRIPKAKIIGYKNSTAEEYAKKRKLVFEIKPIAVTVNGTPIVFDQPPVILKGRVMVPLRAIFEALEVQVNWDGERQTITAEKGTAKIIVKIGSKQATVNGTMKNLDVPAQIINNRTLVPVRFISESLGAEVNWEAQAQTVTIRR